MKLAILGYGAEGKSVEKYFKTHPYDNIPPEDIEISVFDNFEDKDIDSFNLEQFDVIFRSPSVRPHYDFWTHDQKADPSETAYLNNQPYWTSATKYFFSHCPAEIIAVTGTKGKGTTCSMIKAILDGMNLSKNYLVGNIGIPPLDVLDQITEHDNVIFEMSSFQLWDLHTSPYISVILRIEPDHLNVHKDFDEYTYAKAALARYNTKNDYLVYYNNNPVTKKIAETSPAHLLHYPIEPRSEKLEELLNNLTVPGSHNRENAEAALLAVAARFFAGDIEKMLASDFYSTILSSLHDFSGLPHRCQFLRELNHVKYYDDNYCTALPSLDVALNAFHNQPLVLIAGGFSKGTDDEIKKRIFSTKNLEKVILIGSTAKYLAKDAEKNRYEIADSLTDAVNRARVAAEKIATAKQPAVVLMSPGFASFDMFKNATNRGEQYTEIIQSLT